MWKHFCKADKNVISIGDMEKCSWCDKSKEEVPNYPGLFWIYPAQKFVDWPTSLAYYYGLSKNNS